MTATNPPPAISTEVTEFLDFFRQDLDGIAFPDVDAETLEGLADIVRQRASELAELNEQVRAVRTAMEEAQAELYKHSLRGLAYARVYADGDRELSRAVDGLALARKTPTAKTTRKRKAKNKAKSENQTEASDTPNAKLPFSEPSTEAA